LAKEAEINPEILFRTQIGKGSTAWQKAAKLLHLEMLKKSVGLGKNVEVTVWNLAAVRNNEEVLKRLWVFAREVKLNPDEVKYSLLLSKDDDGNTLWHRAAERGSLQPLETLCVWAKEAGTNTVKIKNMSLLARNKLGATAWNIADI